MKTKTKTETKMKTSMKTKTEMKIENETKKTEMKWRQNKMDENRDTYRDTDRTEDTDRDEYEVGKHIKSLKPKRNIKRNKPTKWRTFFWLFQFFSKKWHFFQAFDIELTYKTNFRSDITLKQHFLNILWDGQSPGYAKLTTEFCGQSKKNRKEQKKIRPTGRNQPSPGTESRR